MRIHGRFQPLACFIALLGFVAAAVPVPAQPARWWDPAWRWRIKLVPPPAARGVTATQAQFPIPEGCATGGADVRVIDDRGRLCPLRLIYHQPGLYGIVAFQPNGSSAYWLYLGNPQAPAPPIRVGGRNPARQETGWEPRAGVFLETRRGPGHAADNLPHFRDMAARAGYSYGASYRPRIFDGFNPFGEPDRYLSLYDAYFIAPTAGQYLFATVSSGASFLLVDGRLVCQWPGDHDPYGGQRAQHNGKIHLTKGVHRLEYLHADGGGQHCAEAAWMPPGFKAPRPMEPGDFIPLVACEVGALEERGAPLTADFRAVQTARLIKERYTCTAYQFVNCTALAPGATLTDCRWQFSDGTVYAGGAINKIFFSVGDYTVTQTVRDQAGQTASGTRAFRVHAIDVLKGPEPDKIMPYFVDMALRMPQGMLNESGTLAVARLLEDAERTAEATRAYLDLIERQWKISQKIDPATVQALVELFAEKLRRPAEAETVLRTQLERVGENAPARARLLLELGRVQLVKLGQPEPARASLRGARLQAEKGTDRALTREILMALGDACRALAAPEEALEAYRAAEALVNPAERQKYDRSSFALATEAYLRDGRLDDAAAELKKWTELYPTERSAGYATILEARLMARRRNVAGAADYLRQFLKNKPLGVFAQMALEDLGDFERELGRPAEARQVYQRVLEEFQDETVRSRIRNKLDEMGSSPSPTPAARP